MFPGSSCRVAPIASMMAGSVHWSPQRVGPHSCRVRAGCGYVLGYVKGLAHQSYLRADEHERHGDRFAERGRALLNKRPKVANKAVLSVQTV